METKREVTFQIVLTLTEADDDAVKAIETRLNSAARRQLIFTGEKASVAKIMDREVPDQSEATMTEREMNDAMAAPCEGCGEAADQCRCAPDHAEDERMTEREEKRAYRAWRNDSGI